MLSTLEDLFFSHVGRAADGGRRKEGITWPLGATNQLITMRHLVFCRGTFRAPSARLSTVTCPVGRSERGANLSAQDYHTRRTRYHVESYFERSVVFLEQSLHNITGVVSLNPLDLNLISFTMAWHVSCSKRLAQPNLVACLHAFSVPLLSSESNFAHTC